MTEVKYNNINPFENIAPTPFVGRDFIPIFYKDRYCAVERFILEGQITGKCETFQEIIDRKRSIINSFSQSFRPFSIEEDSNIIYSSPVTKVVSVNFGDSNLMTLIPFSIELECYPSGFHSGFFGIIDPINEFSFQENNDKTVSLVHTVGAKGIHTQNNDALSNAKNYVHSVSGWLNQIDPLFISGVNDSLVLKSIQENVDRFSASYSLIETYKYDSENDSSGILRYSVNFNSGSSDFIEASIEGTIEGGYNVPMSILRQRYSGINFYNLASGEFSNVSSGVLNQYPVNFSFEENPFQNNISFNISYNNDPYPNPYLIDTVRIKKTKTGLNSLSIEGVVKWRGNCLCNNEFGVAQIENFINNYDFYGHASTKWTQYGMPGSLNPNPTSKSYSKNKSKCEYRIQLTYEEQTNNNLPNELESFDYTLNVSPAIPQYAFTPVICEGEYIINRLKFDRRAKYSINGVSVIKECADFDLGLALIKSEINRLSSIYVIGTRKVLESFKITQGNEQNPRIINFSATWSAESPRAFDIIYDSEG